MYVKLIISAAENKTINNLTPNVTADDWPSNQIARYKIQM